MPSQVWSALRFMAKVGDPAAPPPAFIAPHQPRLDWQMWFAALGSWRHNPWLLHLMLKVLRVRVLPAVLRRMQVDVV